MTISRKSTAKSATSTWKRLFRSRFLLWQKTILPRILKYDMESYLVTSEYLLANGEGAEPEIEPCHQV